MAKTVVWQVIPHLAMGGATRVALWLCQYLDPEQYEVALLTGSHDGQEGNLWDDANRLVPVQVLPDLRRDAYLPGDVKTYRTLRALIRERGPDIVHAHGWAFHDFMNPLARAFAETSTRRALRDAAAIVAVSEATHAKGLKAGIGKPERYHVIYPGVDLARFTREGCDPAQARRELPGSESLTR